MRLFLCALASFLAINLWAQNTTLPEPKGYVCRQTLIPINIDGQGTEAAWQKAPFSDLFIDIEGDKKPRPAFDTRMKMLWDSSYLYFYAEMEEPHLWAKITQRDAVIFYDNDFEIFIDPDGDTHNYHEFEVNALNTVWDLLLTRPYRDGGRPLTGWDFKGLKSAVHLNGSLNDASDTDVGWSVEVAIPWKALKDGIRAKKPPREGEQWRINFSRVQWETEIIDGNYQKKKNPDTGKNLPEHNWVWSPQRIINMHEPEFWGIVQFTAQPPGSDVALNFNQRQDYQIRGILYSIHRAQRSYYRRLRRYSDNLDELGIDMSFFNAALNKGDISIEQLKGDGHGYILEIKDHQSNTNYFINESGLSRKIRK